MTHHFDSTVFKTRADGVQVLSTTLEPGETLANGTTYEDIVGTSPVLIEEAPEAEELDDDTEAEEDDTEAEEDDEPEGDIEDFLVESDADPEE